MGLNITKPTVGGSQDTWGTELNTLIDNFDNAVITDNFARNTSADSGLNAGYKAGRIRSNASVNNVSASTVLLTDNQTNYVEVASNGTVSANTTGFTAGRYPLYTIVTAGGAIGATTDKRCYNNILGNTYYDSALKIGQDADTLIDFSTSNKIVFRIDGTDQMYLESTGLGLFNSPADTLDITLNQNNQTGILLKNTNTNANAYCSINFQTDTGTSNIRKLSSLDAFFPDQLVINLGSDPLSIVNGTDTYAKWDTSKNLLLWGAVAETGSGAVITMKQESADPSTSTADQISIFATSGANCSLGLRTEAAVAADTDETKFSDKLPVLINGTSYYIMLTQT